MAEARGGGDNGGDGIGNGDHITINGGYITGNGGLITGNGGDITGNGGYITINGGYITGNGGDITGNGGHITGNGGHITANGGYITGNGGHITGNGGYITGNGGHITDNGVDGAGNGGDGGYNGGHGTDNGGDGGNNGGHGTDNGGDGGDNGGHGTDNGGDGGGSPGPGRAELFSTVMDAFLEKLLAAGSYRRFAGCYRGFSKLQPELTKSIHKRFVTQLQASIQAEIQEVMEEGNLKVVLNNLDKIVEEGKTQEESAWRPSGIPAEDARSALVPSLLRHRSFLLRALRTKRKENRKVARSVLRGRGRISELQQQIQAHRRGWQALNEEQQELVLSLQEPQ